MKIFVTGATGKVGSRFTAYMLKEGHQVRILVRDAERAKGLEEQGAEIVEGNLLQAERLTEALRGTDAVVHLAAQFRGVSEEVAWASNLDATQALANAALQAGVKRFVFSSTGMVYSGMKRDVPCRENDPLQPIMAYPRTKVAAENALQELHREQGLDLRIIRIGFVYGDGDRHIQEAAPLLSQWNAACPMSLVHHEDVCQALLLAAVTPDIAGRVFNAVDDTPIAVGELLRLNGLPTQDSAEEEPDLQQVLDPARIKQELGFQAKYASFHEAKEQGAL
ncbi:NAD(P)-dependent oxidoreductase [Saccharibacillus sacchari]|uniref:NAD(P)-dependent oxidoreductase n=1 Tax=Saccharibacillus sacchari TaxID=456493 RepID=A0ACC6P9G4_9BACL